MNVIAILAALLRLPPFYLDASATTEVRTAFLTPTAIAIASVASKPEDAAALIAQGFAETKYASLVLTGHCDAMPKGMQCDHGRARGAWQNWRVGCRNAYQYPDGSPESAREAARCTLGTMHLGLARCASWEGAFAAMRGQWGCNWEGSAKRVQLMRKILGTWQ